MRHSLTMSDTPIPRAGLVLPGLLSLGWGLNRPIMKVVIEAPHWQDFVALVLVLRPIATVPLPARPPA